MYVGDFDPIGGGDVAGEVFDLPDDLDPAEPYTCGLCGTAGYAMPGGLPVCGECWLDVKDAASLTFPDLFTDTGRHKMETALHAALTAKSLAA